jgi:hypothetical protein
LRAWNHAETAPPSYTAANVAPYVRVVSSLLRGVRWVLAGATNPETMLEWAFDVIPLWARTGVSASCGLEFSLSRTMLINMVSGDQEAVARMIRGHDIRSCDLTDTIELETSAFDHWLALIRTAAIDGRLKTVARIATRMVERAEPTVLHRVIQLHKDTEAARKPGAVAAELRKKYATFVPAGALECEMLAELRTIIDPPVDQPARPGSPTGPRIHLAPRGVVPGAPPTPRPK